MLNYKKLIILSSLLLFNTISYATSTSVDNNSDKDDFFNADGAGSVSTIKKNQPVHDSVMNALTDDEAKKQWNSKYLYLLSQSHLFDVKFPDVKNVGLQFQNVKLSLKYSKNFGNNLSESNLNAQNCSINFYFGLHNHALILNDDDKNLTFMYLHELGHCLLSESVFSKGVNWTNALTNQMGKDNANKLNQELVYASLSEMKKHHQDSHNIYDGLDDTPNVNTKVIPLVVYHEMFADTQAMVWIAKMYPDSFDSILDSVIAYRKNDYQVLKSKHISSDHPTFYALEVLKQYVQKHPNDLVHYNALEAKNLALNASQIGFLNYLKEQEEAN
jgi:hypothetical protein